MLPFAMYRALPCSDYYGSSVTISDIQEPALYSRASGILT